MKPFEGTPERGSIERIFNYRLSRGRRVSENAFGLLSSVYHVLRKPMLLEPKKARKIVLATIYLHNFLRKRADSAKLYTFPGPLDTEENGGILPVGRWRIDQPMSSLLPMQNIPRRSTNDAKRIRLHLARHFITNGTIPWQNNYQ
ncbi:hypothetical protein NQ314_020926 [Rhamnusium bicolor]|uniref:DDE Tnp4 domain-containing protein n=1 Tax=Rhamnusium bicolor TaxID=1586634 RepID=A0AAV8WK62_9CUCU|nr:hypothetical protein NQ314_020926 [Rhamnusium bicolor]